MSLQKVLITFSPLLIFSSQNYFSIDELEFSAVNMRKAMPIPHKWVSKQNDIYVVECRMYDLWYAGSGSPYI